MLDTMKAKTKTDLDLLLTSWYGAIEAKKMNQSSKYHVGRLIDVVGVVTEYPHVLYYLGRKWVTAFQLTLEDISDNEAYLLCLCGVLRRRTTGDGEAEYKWASTSKVKSHLQAVHLIYVATRGDLRYNEMARLVEYRNQPLENPITLQHCFVNSRLDISLNPRAWEVAVVDAAQFDSYSPVAEYLKRVWAAYKDELPGQQIYDQLAEALQTDCSPITTVMLKKFCRAQVARALRPGCKVDTVLIMVGKQGYQKSKAVQIFGGGIKNGAGVYNHSTLSTNEIMSVGGKSWVVELAEIDKIYHQGKSNDGHVKALLSTEIDTTRKFHAQHAIQVPRSFVFVGTSNETQLLSDPTGSRRFWLVDIKRKIDDKKLKEIIPLVHAQAMADLEAGLAHWLTDDEERMREASSVEYQIDFPLQHEAWVAAAIWGYKGMAPSVSLNRTVTNLAHQARVSNIALGRAFDSISCNSKVRTYGDDRAKRVRVLNSDVPLSSLKIAREILINSSQSFRREEILNDISETDPCWNKGEALDWIDQKIASHDPTGFVEDAVSDIVIEGTERPVQQGQFSLDMLTKLPVSDGFYRRIEYQDSYIDSYVQRLAEGPPQNHADPEQWAKSIREAIDLAQAEREELVTDVEMAYRKESKQWLRGLWL